MLLIDLIDPGYHMTFIFNGRKAATDFLNYFKVNCRLTRYVHGNELIKNGYDLANMPPLVEAWNCEETLAFENKWNNSARGTALQRAKSSSVSSRMGQRASIVGGAVEGVVNSLFRSSSSDSQMHLKKNRSARTGLSSTLSAKGYGHLDVTPLSASKE
ncbi:hypothetical protein SARC_00478 [Sphaeroforma arctica JP610]|uniref:Uncharacterized protein n=1 Tax=Sphaeroforma arctica JP610 TaxID=667725 RepID=A0A0L0GET7_9EUKA|nr:hypothetical protein SARC_00478 [Sphaeroforma arctica JP610]KNC87386.1 hypothetical protein SARC_00478 [Sphaeroforma arctica JP610]|eukprot:XP_014161288.1 hypothetical protein SARC_00478 [Sphaeroforma arctica JP610]